MAPVDPPVFVFVFGSPGAGKSTLCKHLASGSGNLRNDIIHLSVGNYLRQRSVEGTLPKNVDEAIKNQKTSLIPWDELQPVLNTKIEEEHNQNRNFILLDGFPRNQEQLNGFTSMGNYVVGMAIFLDCPKQIAMQRYLERQDPLRSGDNAQIFEGRFDKFEKNNPALIAQFAAQGKLVTVNTGTHLGVQHTFEGLVGKLQNNQIARGFFFMNTEPLAGQGRSIFPFIGASVNTPDDEEKKRSAKRPRY